MGAKVSQLAQLLPRPRFPQSLASLILLGLITESIHAAGLLAFPLSRYYDVPLLDLGKLTGHAPLSGVLYLVAISLLFGCYVLALRIVHDASGRQVLLIVVSLAVVYSLTLVAVYPWGATDVYDYAIGGRIISRHHQNPFSTRGIDLPDDPWIEYAPWSDTTSAYGPLWALLAAGSTWLAGDHLLANVLAFKGLALVAYWCAVALVALIWRKHDRRRMAEAVLFLSWNPLVLLETLANGHNDALMAAALLLSLHLLLRGRSMTALIALAASAMVKFVSAALFPLILTFICRSSRGNRRNLWGATLSIVAFAAPIALLSLPFLHNGDALALGRRFQMFTTSLPTLVRALMNPWLGSLRSTVLAQGVAWGLFGAFCIWQLVSLRACAESVLGASYELIYFYLAFTCAWFQPWYLIWLVALGALCLDRPRAIRAHTFAYCALLSYFLIYFLWFWFGLQNTPPSTFRVVTSAVVILPQAGLWLWQHALVRQSRLA